MKILWRRGESAVNDLVAAMPDGETLAYNSVLTPYGFLNRRATWSIGRRAARLSIDPVLPNRKASRSEVDTSWAAFLATHASGCCFRCWATKRFRLRSYNG